MLVMLVGVAASATEPTAGTTSPQAPQMLRPHEAVHRGNELLTHGDPKAALDQYENASQTLPDAREIAFDEGLAQHAMGNQEQARTSFEKALLDPPDALADDALYSIAASEHAEALAPNVEPKQKISKLESAMEKYQEVLSRRPDHGAARDSNEKAATYWRQIKQQLQQQQQQQQSQKNDQDKDQKQDQNQDQQQANQQQDQNEKQDSQQQQAQKQENQSQQQQAQNEPQQEEQQSQSADQKNKEEQQKNAEAKNDQKKEDQKSQDAQAQKPDEKQSQDQKASADQTAMITREQAERQLREMLQAMQDRNKLHREDATPPPVPATKDW